MECRNLLAWSCGCLILGLQACSGGGGSSSGGGDTLEVEGLAGPSQVTIVSADEESSSSSTATTSGGIAPGSNLYPADSDYNTDQARTWVFDPSMESLEQVNSILCYIDKTAYADMVNLGDYIAQINTSICETGENGGSEESEEGQSSGRSEDFQYFTVRSVRESRDDPQLTSIWVPQDDGPAGEGTIFVRLEVNEAASDENPTGDFQMSFATAPSYDEIASPVSIGVLRSLETDQALGYQFYEDFGDVDVEASEGDFSREVALTVEMDEAQENGSARIRIRERYNFGAFSGGDSGIQTTEWRVAFNDTHFKRQADDDDPITLSRSDFNTTVWRYNLYYADGDNIGEQVELNSGFPFATADGQYGWAGYYGMWTPEETSLDSGDTVYRQEFGDDSLGEAYTVVKAPGRLIRSERHQLDVVDRDGQNLQLWDFETGVQYRCEYDTGAFYKVAQFDEETSEWTPVDPPELIDPEVYGGFIGFWSDSLGGQVNWVDGDDFVTFFEESFVNGSDELFDGATDGQVELYGFFECLKASMSASDVESGDIYLPDADSVADAHAYVFDADNLTLYLDSNGDGSSLGQVGLADGEEPDGGPFMWGMRSGPLVTDTSSLADFYDIWNLDVFYFYETGPNDWNQFQALQDSTGEYVSFDPPLQFLYTHSTDNDRNGSDDYDGQSFFLEYNGPGDLWGIPFEQGEFAGEDEFERWFPAFSIADGVLMGPEGTEYVIRGLEMEQTLVQDETGADALSLAAATALTLPDETLYETPDIGVEPEVDEAPAVIDGVVQGSDE